MNRFCFALLVSTAWLAALTLVGCSQASPPSKASSHEQSDTASVGRFKITDNGPPTIVIDGKTGRVWRIDGEEPSYAFVPVCYLDAESGVATPEPLQSPEGNEAAFNNYCGPVSFSR